MALVEVGGEKVFPEIQTLWNSPRFQGEGLSLKRPLILAIAKRRSPEAGQTLITFWIQEKDLQVQDLLAQALKGNLQVNQPLLSKTMGQSADPIQKQRLQSLISNMTAQEEQLEESRRLGGLSLNTPEALTTLKGVLERPGTENKSLAMALLEKEGSPQALESLLAYAKRADPSLRPQAMLSICRKAKSPDDIASWFAQAPEFGSDLLGAIGQSGNPVFLPWVSTLPGPQAKRAQDLLQMAENRRKLGLQP